MGKIKLFVTKPRNCDAFATMAPTVSARAFGADTQGEFVNDDHPETGRPLLRSIAGRHVTGTGARRPRPDRAIRMVRISRLRPGRFDAPHPHAGLPPSHIPRFPPGPERHARGQRLLSGQFALRLFPGPADIPQPRLGAL